MNRIELAQFDVLDAARCVVNSYRATGGYTGQLAVNLRRLATAQGELDAAVYVDHRDRLNAGRDVSDNAGWDRSVLWGEVAASVEASPQSIKAAAVEAPEPRRKQA